MPRSADAQALMDLSSPMVLGTVFLGVKVVDTAKIEKRESRPNFCFERKAAGFALRERSTGKRIDTDLLNDI